MFIEPNIKGGEGGWIEVICGSMFSGKTEELIRRLKRARLSSHRVEIFKPKLDSRFHADKIVSHDENSIHSTPVAQSSQILLLLQDVDVVGIDEAQFFDAGLPQVCETLARRGIRVVVAGLDMDYTGQPFGPIASLLARADYVTKLHAICTRCGNRAQFSYRKIPLEEQVLLGAKEVYEPRCRKCFTEGLKP